MSSTLSPPALYLDFDSTLTEHDTLSALCALAPLHRPKDLPALPPFSTFTDAYLADLNAHSHAHASAPRKSAESDSSLGNEIAHLRSLRPIEDASLNRLESAGWFRGLQEAHMVQGARDAIQQRDVVLRAGWLELVSDFFEKGGTVVIVSVNWSRRWVEECLRAAADVTTPLPDRHGLDHVFHRIKIIANELQGLDDTAHGASGTIQGPNSLSGERLMSSEDKKRVLDIKESERSTKGSVGGTTVYVGDSMTDLEALLAVDIGIVVRNGERDEMSTGQKELADGLDRIEVETRWIGEYGSRSNGSETSVGRKTVWCARDFREISRGLKDGLS